MPIRGGAKLGGLSVDAPGPLTMTHYLACKLPPALAERLLTVSAQLRVAPVKKAHIDDGAKVMLQLVELTLDFYFLQPVEQLQVSGLAQKTARLGIKTAQGGMSMIINRLAHHLSDAQLAILADLLEGFVVHKAEA